VSLVSTSGQPGWGDAAESYDAWYRTPQGRRYDALEKELLSSLLRPAGRRRLLEIGCGTGHFTRWFRDLGWRAWGLDIEPRMLARARGHSPGDIIYCRGDAERLPFADASFDICALITTLESTDRPVQALGEALRVSRRAVLLGVLNAVSLLALRRRVRALFRPTIFSRTRFYSGPQLSALIRRAAHRMSLPVSVRFAAIGRSPFQGLPRGAFYAVRVEHQKSVV
jgi:ubiquinone/menaquinone biosynthesis C-methylase UbiE